MATELLQLQPYNLPPESLYKEKPSHFNLSHKTILSLLTTKCNTSVRFLQQVHALSLKYGLFQDHFVAGTLINCYANPDFNTFTTSLKVFEQVPNPNVFVWNFVIKGCIDNQEPLKAIKLYHNMVVSSCRSNKYTFPPLFKACTMENAVEEGIQVHGNVVKNGFSSDLFIGSCGIQMYASFGRLVDARKMFDVVPEPDVVCYNAMIDGFMKSGDVGAATGMFHSMQSINVGTWNAMINGLVRNGMIDEARDLFRETPKKDEISWSVMIDGYNREGCFKEALDVFDEMQKKGIRPSKFILSSAVAACGNVGALEQGEWLHAYARRNLIPVDGVLGTSLVDMYAKCGRLDLAKDVFESMKHKETASWNAMIGGLAVHGRAMDAIDLFLKMQNEKLKPNSITFVSILSACAHAGLVDQGMKYLNTMKEEFGVEPTVEHYGCAVDLLGRAGHLTQAEELIICMPVQPNAAVWGALLNACRIHGNHELGERIGELLLEMEPKNSGRYALVSNIYAKAGRLDDVVKLRKLMKERGVRTIPGKSMISLDGKVHEFKMGEETHPQMKGIYLMVETIMEKLQSEGHIPETSSVLFDLCEEEKETTLKYHSEKLAISFGLLNTKPGATIRVMKNLRVCDDCHSATKLISKIYRREIIMRDRSRFHHFKDGECSCVKDVFVRPISCFILIIHPIFRCFA